MKNNHGDGDVAIIGMSCRVAGANSPSELWDLLASSRDVQSEITRFNVNGYYHPEGGARKGLTNVKRAYMLDDDVVDRFDHAFFHVTPVEARAMDPQQRMLLEIAYEAVENAGIPLQDFTGTDTAVYTGSEGADYASVLARDIDATPKYTATGTATCMTANRLSYFYDLSGPSLSVDTACSSTMAALNQAVRTLQADEASMALVCGGKLIFNPDMFPASSELGFLSPSGRSRCFDAAGDGYGRGEGVLAILLKPLKEALVNMDPIRAVIKGTQLNQDGRTKGITLPSAEAQKNNMVRLYSRLDLSPNDIQYVEAHGTGTSAGDPLEISAINSVYGLTQRDERLVVGSVKSNIGHLEACSALASIIKVVECLERAKLPPQLHLNHPNPKINFEHIQIPLEVMEWPRTSTGVRRAAINTFGAGGTNGHAVLEAYPRSLLQPSTSGRPLLFKVSAADRESLRRLSLKYADYVESKKPNLDDLAHTLLSRRSTLKYSLFLTASTYEVLLYKLRDQTLKTYTKGTGDVKKVAFLFTGQGAQWAQMGKTLIDQSSIFKGVMLTCEQLLRALPDKPTWSIIDELAKDGESTNVYQSAYSQPLCTALQLGLVVLWRSWGLVPVAVVGHSSGEIAASYATGMISLRDAIVTAYYRGLHLSNATSTSSSKRPRGGMCAVGLGEEDAVRILEGFRGRVQLAAVNGPTSCTLSGDKDAIELLVKDFTQAKIFCRELRVDMAYHSHHMLSAACRYERALQDAKVSFPTSPTTCDMFSSVTGRLMDLTKCLPLYWKQNMVSTVRFSAALTACIRDHPELSMVFEVGPHSALKAPTIETLRNLGRESVQYFNSCLRGKNDFESLLDSAGGMLAGGAPLNSGSINARGEIDDLHCKYVSGNTLTDLPSYQWDHSNPFWAESKISRNIRYREFPRHQLLGSRYSEAIQFRPSWRNLLMLKEVPWLTKLKNDGVTLMPPATFILMALEAARRLQVKTEPNARSLLLFDMTFCQQLPLALFKTPDSVVELHLVAHQTDGANQFRFEILSETTKQQQVNCKQHCSGAFGWTISAAGQPHLAGESMGHEPQLLKYSQILGRDLSSKFKTLNIAPEEISGSFDVGLDESAQHENYCINPVVLDSILQLPPVSLLGGNLPAQYAITSIRSILVPVDVLNISSGGFATQVNRKHSYGCQSNIEIYSDDFLISISDVSFEADHLIEQKPVLRTLYSKPVTLPDISRLPPCASMSLWQVLELLTHKWPMSDIGLIQMAGEEAHRILKSLPGALSGERSRFRSVKVIEGGTTVASDRVQAAKQCGTDAKYQLIFVNDPNAEEIVRLLHPSGLACVKSLPVSEEGRLSTICEKICKLTGFDHENWTLWRKTDMRTSLPAPAGRTVKIFACPNQDVSSINCLPDAEHVRLEPLVIESYCCRNKTNRYDAVIVDCVKNSVILTWPGQQVVPWLRHLVRMCDNILWISQLASKTPYNNVAGNLLRTLQSEQPTINVTWLVFEDREPLPIVQAAITSAYGALLRGENEGRLEVKNSQFNILRYLPDDELSIATGLLPPRSATRSLVGKHYRLSLAAPQKPVIVSSNSYSNGTLAAGNIRITVEASVIDDHDLMALNGTCRLFARPELGMFFSGRVISHGSRDYPPGSRVVGWHNGAHCNQLDIFPRKLRPYDIEIPPATAATSFATLTTSLCIVDGIARARVGDKFRIQMEGILADAIGRLCVQYGATVLKHGGSALPDFTISLGLQDGLQVNGSAVNVQDYLESDHGYNALKRVWEEREGSRTPIHSLRLNDSQRMTRISNEQAYSTAIIHADLEQVENTVALYVEPQSLFTTKGAYVIIGGLGGLGRWVCSWMVANGARKLIVISRSGLKSQDAQDLFETINASEASMEVKEADACDPEAIGDTFGQIRKICPIKGVINMAMLLGDAPLADMTGEQWDRALRLKVDSNWILHEETLQDQLEFFIMFSSIASVLGNRNQAGYNVGNTFLNALAAYRRSLGLTAVSIALGAMTEIGILHELGKDGLLQTLNRAGLSHLGKAELGKIMEAAVAESHHSERSMILTGLEMFERVDGKLVGSIDQQQLYWTELPEFSLLQSHRLSDGRSGPAMKDDLREQVQNMDAGSAIAALLDAFFSFLSELLGFPTSTLDPTSSLSMYGLDSLSAVSCQYWFHKGHSLCMSYKLKVVANAA
ncbi:MAG: Type I Iterative PKS [Candelaria pacifica]|nr:MAG: Type I Iterative PKS [Candelaria pacifica]